jgi:hypothetical protein
MDAQVRNCAPCSRLRRAPGMTGGEFSTTGRSLRFAGIVSSPRMKNILLYRIRNWEHNPRRPAPTEGRFAIVTIRRARDAMDAVASGDPFTGRERSQRTAKSCGPGAATLALSRWSDPPATGARKAASPGRARISRKTIARGKPGCLGCTCSSTRVLSFTTFAHGTAGAVSARLSLRPLRERDDEMANLGRKRAARMLSAVWKN